MYYHSFVTHYQSHLSIWYYHPYSPNLINTIHCNTRIHITIISHEFTHEWMFHFKLILKIKMLSESQIAIGIWLYKTATRTLTLPFDNSVLQRGTYSFSSILDDGILSLTELTLGKQLYTKVVDYWLTPKYTKFAVCNLRWRLMEIHSMLHTNQHDALGDQH